MKVVAIVEDSSDQVQHCITRVKTIDLSNHQARAVYAWE
jgi:hypothetical protein